MPTTLDFNKDNQKHNHEPLNPVEPVTIIFYFYKF